MLVTEHEAARAALHPLALLPLARPSYTDSVLVSSSFNRWRLLLTGLILVCIAVLIITMVVKQHIYNAQGEMETVTELIQGCNNITYEKMTEGYYTWEMYSSMSKGALL